MAVALAAVKLLNVWQPLVLQDYPPVTLDFTTLEFKLLSFFIRRRGHVLTRNQVLDEIWGSATHVTDRVIDTHIANLRKKIEGDPSQPRHLASVRGIGYRFDG